MSDAVDDYGPIPSGISGLPRDLTQAELQAAPVLSSTDALLIEELTEDEDDAFATAIGR